MDRIKKSPEEVLADAAQAAQELLPDLMRERDKLRIQLAAVEQRINLMTTVTTSGGLTIPSISDYMFIPGELSSTVKDDALIDRIKWVLKRQPDITPKEIAELIKVRFGIEPAQSSLYATLNRSRLRGKLDEKDGKWSLAKK